MINVKKVSLLVLLGSVMCASALMAGGEKDDDGAAGSAAVPARPNSPVAAPLASEVPVPTVQAGPAPAPAAAVPDPDDEFYGKPWVPVYRATPVGRQVSRPFVPAVPGGDLREEPSQPFTMNTIQLPPGITISAPAYNPGPASALDSYDDLYEAASAPAAAPAVLENLTERRARIKREEDIFADNLHTIPWDEVFQLADQLCTEIGRICVLMRNTGIEDTSEAAERAYARVMMKNPGDAGTFRHKVITELGRNKGNQEGWDWRRRKDFPPNEGALTYVGQPTPHLPHEVIKSGFQLASMFMR